MPPVGILTGLAMMAYGASIGTGILAATMVFGGLLQVAMSVVSMNSPKSVDAPADAAGQMVNTRDPQENLPLIYGQQRVGVSLVYMTTSGANNKYLHDYISGNVR